jgi:pimeloyl-ACP methyl ester carboxylesterase
MSFRCSVDGPAVVLVHGLGLSGRYMLPVAEPLAPRYPVYMPDLPGFSASFRICADRRCGGVSRGNRIARLAPSI